MPARVVPLAAARFRLIVVRSAASPGVPFVRADSGRRAAPKAGCGWVGQSGATRRREFSPPVGRPAGIDVGAVDVDRADGPGLYEACPI